MMREKSGMRLLGALLCLSAAVSTPPASADEPARRGAVEAIREVDARWSEDLFAGRLDQVMENYDDNAAFLVHGSPIIRGKPAIRAWFRERLDTPGYSARFRPTEIIVAASGEMAYELGEFEATVLSDGKRMRVKGKHLVTWKWNGSRWLVTAESINTDGPAVAG